MPRSEADRCQQYQDYTNAQHLFHPAKVELNPAWNRFRHPTSSFPSGTPMPASAPYTITTFSPSNTGSPFSRRYTCAVATTSFLQ